MTRIFVESSSTSFFYFDYDSYAFTSTRRIFSTMTQGIRRRVDVFPRRRTLRNVSSPQRYRGRSLSPHSCSIHYEIVPSRRRLQYRVSVEQSMWAESERSGAVSGVQKIKWSVSGAGGRRNGNKPAKYAAQNPLHHKTTQSKKLESYRETVSENSSLPVLCSLCRE